MTPERIKAQLAGNCIPNGYMYTLVSISLTKRALADDMPPGERLELLQSLAFYETSFKPEQIAAVEPMCNKGLKIVAEAMKLGDGGFPPDGGARRPGALDMFASHFTTFASLNPSLVTALKMQPGFRLVAEAEGLAS
jgi:hypothetical protein